MRRALLVAAIAASLLNNPGASSSLVDSLWSLLSSASAAVDAGCIADPDGRCQPSSGLQIDEGCIADPDGRCHPMTAPQTDAGCGADPDGCPSGS